MSYVTVPMHGSPVTKVVRHVVPWLVLVGVLAVVFNAFGNYQEAAEEAAKKAIPAALQLPKTDAGEASMSGTVKDSSGKKIPASKAYVAVKFDGLNFRKQPNRAADKIRALDKGERLKWLATDNGWYKVKDSDGDVGWVAASSQYTKLVKGR